VAAWLVFETLDRPGQGRNQVASQFATNNVKKNASTLGLVTRTAAIHRANGVFVGIEANHERLSGFAGDAT
jgi:hypothetical protein